MFRFDAPMSKDSIINFGGDLYVMISTGLVPMTTLIRAETEQLGKVRPQRHEGVRGHLARPTATNTAGRRCSTTTPTTRSATCRSATASTSRWCGRCRARSGRSGTTFRRGAGAGSTTTTYFGSEDGGIYLGGSEYLNDNGAAINADVRFAWCNFGSVSKKNFKMIRLYTITDGLPRPFMDLEVDYNNVPPTNQPEVTAGPSGGAEWDMATWDVDYWAQPRSRSRTGRASRASGASAPRASASASPAATFSLTGVDVLYELGGLM